MTDTTVANLVKAVSDMAGERARAAERSGHTSGLVDAFDIVRQEADELTTLRVGKRLLALINDDDPRAALTAQGETK